MNENYIIQYTLVGIIVALACIWILVKVFRKKSNRNSGCHSGCCGCSIKDRCDKPQNPDRTN